MTVRAADEPRLRPVASPWGGASRRDGRRVAAAAAVSMAALFGVLWWMLRERPLERPRAGFPSPPDLGAQLAAAQERLKADPQDISALVERGTLLFQKGRGEAGQDSYIEAIGDLEEARDLGALDPRIFYCLGVMYQDEGLAPFALTEYRRFLRHYPEDKEVRLLAAKLAFSLGLFAEAVNDYERLRFSDPDDPLVAENLGLSLLAAKQAERAAAVFDRLRARGGNFGRRADCHLGQMALDSGRVQEARDRLSACLSGGPPPGVAPERAYAGLAAASQKLGRWEEAKASWEAVLKAVPGDSKARAGLREAERRLAAARREAERAARRQARTPR